MILETMKKFGDVIGKLDHSLERMNDRLDKMEADLRNANDENGRLMAENTKLKNDLDAATTQLEVEAELRERQARRFNIKITGIGIGGKRKHEIVEDVVKFVNDNIDNHIENRDIYDVHVIKGRQTGDATANKQDTIIVALQTTELKKKFYKLSKRCATTADRSTWGMI